MIDEDYVIKEGDTVDVFFNNEAVGTLFDTRVLSLASKGEPWILQDKQGRVHYIMAYARISRQRKSEALPERQKI